MGNYYDKTPRRSPFSRSTATTDLELNKVTHNKMTDIGLLLFRVFTLMLTFHGVAKISSGTFVDVMGNFPVGSAAPFLFGWMIMLGQTFLPVLIALGFFTRISAGLMAVMKLSIVLFVNVMSPDYTLLNETGGLTGESAMMFAWLALPLVFTGAGRLSVDWMLFGSKGKKSY